MTKLLGAIAFTGLISTAAVAATLTPKEQIEARQAGYKKIGGTFKALNDQLRSPSPDKAQIAALATQLKTLTAPIPTWFPAGTGPEAGIKTAAKGEIWQRKADFNAKAKALNDETAKLAAIAAAGDIAAIQAQVKATAGKCSACHSDYRQKDS